MVDLSMANWQCHNQRVSRIFKVNPQPWMVSLTEPPLPLPLLFLDLHWPETPLAPRAKALAETQRLHLPGRFTAWWFIPLSKWGITPVINGISRVNPLITGVITHLLSGMNHQVVPCWVTNPMHPGNFHGRRNQLLNLTLIKKPEKPSVDRPSRWNARPVGINIPMISHINEYIYIYNYIYIYASLIFIVCCFDIASDLVQPFDTSGRGSAETLYLSAAPCLLRLTRIFSLLNVSTAIATRSVLQFSRCHDTN